MSNMVNWTSNLVCICYSGEKRGDEEEKEMEEEEEEEEEKEEKEEKEEEEERCTEE